MSESSITSQVQALIQNGNAALQSGDSYEARKLFRRVIELESDNIDGWLGLAEAVLPYKDKRDYLHRVLEIDPAHQEAQQRLEEIDRRLAAGEILAPARKRVPPEPAPVEHAAETNEQENGVVVTCYRHPDRETGLRCFQCGNPICADCAKPAAVGQLCPDCARERRPPNYQVSPGILALSFILSVVISFGLSLLVLFLLGGFFFALLISFFLGSFVSRLLVRLLDRVTHAKRGKAMQLAVGIGLGVGVAPLLVLVQFQSFALLIFSGVLIFATIAQLR
jgi:hypothetical protein